MNDFKRERILGICSYLPEKLSVYIKNLNAERISKLCEIRIRACKPVTLCFTNERMYITESGRLTSFLSDGLMSFSQKETEEIFVSLCRCSVHSLSDCISQGYITAEGGCRVGIYGTAVTDGNKIRSVRNIGGLNIRISGEYAGIARPVAEKLFCERAHNVLICGPPSSGKTTLIKDLCRILSDEKGYKICIVDERGEMQDSNTGANTDVLDGYPKAAGIQIAVRTLSPEIIAFDEIGTAEEVEAVCGGLNSGVEFIMSVHCADESELKRKPQFRMLAESGAADSLVFLRGTGEIRKIISVKELENENCRVDFYRHGMRSYG